MNHTHAPLVLELSLAKERVEQKEPVLATVSLQNQGESPLLVNSRLLMNEPFSLETHHEISFEIAGPPGYEHASTFLINAGRPERKDFRLLKPGEAFSRTFMITDYYSLHMPGIYQLRATYVNANSLTAFGQPAWMGRINSNWVKLERS